MPKVTFILKDGTQKTVEVPEGQTILEGALENDVPMEHACGGHGFCTTCACKVRDGKKMIDDANVSPPNDKEQNMGLDGPDERLGCQAQVLGDMTVELLDI